MDNPLARKLEHFVRLSDADHLWLAAALGPTRTVAARTDIVEEGDDPTAVFVILDGWAGRYRQLADGRRQIVALLLPGDCCDPHVFLLDRRDHAITALTTVTLARIPGPAFLDLEARSPPLQEAFRRETLITAAVQREGSVSLGRRSAIERMAHLFCELHVRLATVGLAAGNTYPMPLTQVDLADVLGQTAVHTNRVLHDLRAENLITLERRRLTIHDPARLRELALFDPAYLHLTEHAVDR
ncbi:Crp/Fnr family transcriptional regulator [Methylobacterium sp. NEAU 140]|uniref:Crp/Fnr family transcriptional regulator n=1 Tax=Methylobacterium sp. NEAU 140 TaxID=3064945 RepID=UPI0027348750|nr:Crp/Fnr family transcriptional regulator [Methylobacterium sp. NEAU 140]MDP4023899.1 Crp/Fnr family transcriptional regulator [Methylobacterium sp. NEAU 140]